MSYKICIYKTPEEKKTAEADINTYYEIRKNAYKAKLGTSHYDNYPDDCDKLDDTVFMLIKTTDKEGKEVVLGGRRIIFPNNEGSPSLNKSPILKTPKEFNNNEILIVAKNKAGENLNIVGLQKINKSGYRLMKENERIEKLKRFKKGDFLKFTDIVPALQKSRIKYAEMGGYAINQELTKALFDDKEYTQMRNDIYQQTLDFFKENKIDLEISFMQGKLRANYKKWLNENNHENIAITSPKGMVRNIIPNSEYELKAMIVNTGTKFRLTGEKGILRFDQKSANEARNR